MARLSVPVGGRVRKLRIAGDQAGDPSPERRTSKLGRIADAQAATAKQAKAALDFVEGQGIAEKDVKTFSYSISPQYSYPNPWPRGGLCPDYSGSPKVIGYQNASVSIAYEIP
jgi:hypothetical protein